MKFFAGLVYQVLESRYSLLFATLYITLALFRLLYISIKCVIVFYFTTLIISSSYSGKSVAGSHFNRLFSRQGVNRFSSRDFSKNKTYSTPYRIDYFILPQLLCNTLYTRGEKEKECVIGYVLGVNWDFHTHVRDMFVDKMIEARASARFYIVIHGLGSRIEVSGKHIRLRRVSQSHIYI